MYFPFIFTTIYCLIIFLLPSITDCSSSLVSPNVTFRLQLKPSFHAILYFHAFCHPLLPSITFRSFCLFLLPLLHPLPVATVLSYVFSFCPLVSPSVAISCCHCPLLSACRCCTQHLCIFIPCSYCQCLAVNSFCL